MIIRSDYLLPPATRENTSPEDHEDEMISQWSKNRISDWGMERFLEIKVGFC